MPSKARDLTGERFGRLTVIRKTGKANNGHTMYRVRCDCGTEKIVIGDNLTHGKTSSCGCLRKEMCSSRAGEANYFYKHGGTRRERLYRIWLNMKNRCLNPNNHAFFDYGGRGITICDEWLHDYAAFRDWALNNGYSDVLTIDRINNDAGYSPDNCRWATPKQQANNRRPRKRIQHKEKALNESTLPQAIH